MSFSAYLKKHSWSAFPLNDDPSHGLSQNVIVVLRSNYTLQINVL